MPHRHSALAIAATLTLAVAAPAAAAPTIVVPPGPLSRGALTTAQQAATAAKAPTGSTKYADPLAALGAGSPTCRVDLGPQAESNCRSSGAVENHYPLNSYGFDVQVSFNVLHLEKSFLGALQDIAALIWMAFVYAVKAVLLLLEWAFSLDLMGQAMGGVRRTLAYLHDEVIGQPWFLAALSVAGLWGIWRGFVRRQSTQAITGLIASILLMVAGLTILARPDDTVGRASQLANEASLTVLSAATGHNPDRPTRSLGDSMIGVFDSMVRDPWCALEFGSVKYCNQPAPNSKGLTNADVWLQYPAGSDQRTALFHLLKGQPQGGNHGLIHKITSPLTGIAGLNGSSPSVPPDVARMVAKNPDRAALQDSGGTVPRFALLALIAVGMTGAILLLGYLGVRLLLAAVMSLVLLLFAPAVLLAPAFGESGRATFVAWAQRLLGAIVAKLIYALFLAVVLAAAATIRSLNIGWFGTWLLQIAFWWGILIKRHELIGFVSAGAPDHGERGRLASSLGQVYYTAQLEPEPAPQRRPPGHSRYRAPAQRRGAAARERREARRDSDGSAGPRATRHAGSDRAAHTSRRRRTAPWTSRNPCGAESRAIDRSLARYDEKHAVARARPAARRRAGRGRGGAPQPPPRNHRAAQRPEMRTAQQIVAHGGRATGRAGTPVAPSDLAEYRRARARDVRCGCPPTTNATFARPASTRSATATRRNHERAAMRRALRRAPARERGLLAASGD